MRIRLKGVARLNQETGALTNEGDYHIQFQEGEGDWEAIPFVPLTEEELNELRRKYAAEKQHDVSPAQGVEVSPELERGGLRESV